MSSELRLRARRRALRAARAVTLGSALVACGSSHTPGEVDGSVFRDAAVSRDAGVARDAGRDASTVRDATVIEDATMPEDATVVVDAGSDSGLVCPPIFPPTTQACCEAEPGGFWDGEQCIVAVPGPFVPPRMA